MKIHIFDFDGVICDSNNLKTRCLKEAVLKNIHNLAANDFEKHHKLNGGISRYVKFRRITDKYNCPKNTYDSLIADTSEFLNKEYKKLKMVDKAEHVFKKLDNNNEKLFIASGGNEFEIRELCDNWLITRYFEGIYGSPRKKLEICNEIRRRYLNHKINMYGDSKYDYECAANINASFTFISEFADSKIWFKNHMGRRVSSLKDLLKI